MESLVPMSVDEQQYGKWIRRRVYIECPRCGYVDLGPGRLNDDETVEIRTCQDCGSEIETEPYFTCPPSEATAWGLK